MPRIGLDLWESWDYTHIVQPWIAVTAMSRWALLTPLLLFLGHSLFLIPAHVSQSWLGKSTNELLPQLQHCNNYNTANAHSLHYLLFHAQQNCKVIIVFFKYPFFIWKTELMERERTYLHPLTHFPNSNNSQAWARMKSRARCSL